MSDNPELEAAEAHCHAIEQIPDGWRRRQPKKAGDIYRCEKCECYWHSFDGNGELQSGYPC